MSNYENKFLTVGMMFANYSIVFNYAIEKQFTVDFETT